MREEIANIFIFVDDQIVRRVGIAIHEMEGTDDEKFRCLQSKVQSDLPEAKLFSLPDNLKLQLPDGNIINGISLARYLDLQFYHAEQSLFIDALLSLNLEHNTLVCITNVVDGKVKIDGVTDYKPSREFFPEELYDTIAPDYLDIYMTDGNFDFFSLINDDFFDAIRILFNNGKYVSSAKLMMSSIDTFSYLEYGDTAGNFKKWLDEFCDLTSLDVTSEELWEFRNSLLHMTNPSSRKVGKNEVKRLHMYVEGPEERLYKENQMGKYLNYRALIKVVADGIERWAQSLNQDKEKFPVFIDRYDTILSDKRVSEHRF